MGRRLTPEERAARRAGLRYSTDAEPGLRRLRHGAGLRYVDADGRPVRDAEVLARVRALAVPPAYTDVWICADPHGHLQATGRDARGRKQYRYHPEWAAARGEAKYDGLVPFGEALPALRRRVDADLGRTTLDRDRVLALVVGLLDRTHLRVGNREYARTNDSFGLTTLQDDHAEVHGRSVAFRFRGKHGVEHEVAVRDPRLARAVRRVRDLPGQHLFQYVDAAGGQHAVTSTDVNAYLHETTGEAFTAKLFRTWGGTVEGARRLAALGAPADTAAARRAQLVGVVERVAVHLGNTPAVCRKHYVHPALFERFTAGTFADDWARAAVGPPPPPELDADEAALLRLLAG